jgi:starch synthase
MTVFRNRKAWSALQRQAMKTDVSWDASAAEYAELFRALASKE